jgi:hypothetical protein
MMSSSESGTDVDSTLEILGSLSDTLGSPIDISEILGWHATHNLRMADSVNNHHHAIE